ncbi:MAG: AAA family ATPase [Streptococcaceae bacterium]|jgi:DNA helicase-2/ATP-dependent DNA helicase PcrA|nr:AAA family ATPase [Streptococcaceae bacterium]
MKKDFKAEQEHLRTIYKELLVVKKKAEKVLNQHHKEGTKLMLTMKDGISRDISSYSNQLETFSAIEIKNREIDQLNMKHDSWAYRLDTVNRLLKEPYFGRIDLEFENEKGVESFYLGVNSFRTLENEDRVIDWRAPIAELYYNQDLGKSSYKIQDDRVYVNLVLRRQFNLKKDQLIDYYDTSVAINDKLLLQALSSNSSEYMQDITATIQKEQNEIIRDIKSHTLLVNGIAGSGKTSAVLQRIAYLLYQYRQHLLPEDVVLLAPNPVFMNYISKVLPNLGEKNPSNFTMHQLINFQLPNSYKLENQFAYLKRIAKSTVSKQANVLRSEAFFTFLVKKMQNYSFKSTDFKAIKRREKEIFSPQDIVKLYTEIPKTQIANKQVQALAKHIKQNLDKRLRKKARTQKMYDKITQMTEAEQKKYFDEFIKNDSKARIAVLAYQYLKRIYRKTVCQIENFHWVNLKVLFCDFYKEYTKEEVILNDELTVDEGVILLIIWHFFVMSLTKRNVRFVLVDEVQDYSPIQLRLLLELYPRASFTLLGDENQAIFQTYIDFSTITEIFEKAGNSVTQKNLATSYRSNGPITALFKQLAENHKTINVVTIQETGDQPQFIGAKTKEDYEQKLIAILQHLPKDQSTALITKDVKQAEYLNKKLMKVLKIHSFTKSTAHVPGIGINLLPISIAKGLEFDNVILHDVSAENYHSKHDKKLLYTGISRGMKKIFLLYKGSKSHLFGIKKAGT